MLVLRLVEAKERSLLRLLVLLALSMTMAACQPAPMPASPTPLPTEAATPTPTVAEVEVPLSIEITSEPAGDSIAFHVTLTNLASWMMTDVVATVTVPKGTRLLEASTTIPGVTSSFGENEFSFTLPRLAPGGTVELFTYRVNVSPGAFITTQASASWQGKVPGQVTSAPLEASIAVPIQPAAARVTTMALCLEVSEAGLCTSPAIEFQPDVTVYYVFTYENLSSSDEIIERWYLGDEKWTEAALNTEFVIKEGGTSGRFASAGINLSADWMAEVQSQGWTGPGRLEIWLNGELAQTVEFTVLPAAPSAQSTLLVYNTVERLLAGDLLHTVTITDVQADLTAFPPDWPVVGVGTTDWIGRNGEMMPDGTAGNPHFWWADPTTPIGKDGQAMGGAVRDLRSLAPLLLSSPAPQLPFLGLAIGDPATAIIWSLQDIDNVHAWLEEKLADGEIDLAGVQLRGEFGPVKTTVAYNIPLTGLDLSGGYVGSDYFRFGQYITATWTIDGLYAAAPALQRIVSTAGHPLHLHGYQTETMLGGHVGSATAISVTATIWPLSQVNTRRGELRSQTSGEGLVVVLTDFGTTDFYVGAMEGAMYTANPQVRIATITHQVEPFNVAEGSYLLAQAAREFPPGTVSLAVVDPGVGTERRPIVLETWDEKLFVAPDNGLLTGVMDTLGVAHAYQITNRRLIRPGALSTTFHGRDIYGPVAAHLAAGIEPSEVGPEIPVADLVRLPIASARREGAVLVGSVVHVDWYGNLITNIPGRLAEEAGLASGDSLDITIGEQAITATFVTTYGDVPEGDWLALINAEGVVEIARNLASAAETVRASASTEARLERRD